MNNIAEKLREYDYGIYRFFYLPVYQSAYLSHIYLFFAKYGIVFFFLSFIYLILKKRVNAFFTTFVAMALAGFIDLLIVFFWQRPRPFITHGERIMTPITEGMRIDGSSFPSAHTYISFAIATSVFLYGHKKLGTFLFILACFVAIGRVGSGLHYPSDVIGGTLLGIVAGIIAFHLVVRAQKRWE